MSELTIERKSDKDRVDAKGSAPGYIQPKLLKEVWFHTGTVCNLRCSFCLEGSKLGDNRLNTVPIKGAGQVP